MTGPTASHSLRRRLLWFVLAAIALASLVQGSTAYRTALNQADALFDYQLQETARSLRAGIPLAPSLGDDEQTYDVLVQIWGADGSQLYRSQRSELPGMAVLGFSDVQAGGTRYRVYTVQTPLHTVQIAQDLSARGARARTLALQAVWPVALMAPLLMLAVWWLINRSLAPVERARRQVAARAADDLAALPDEGLPEEILPLVRELNLLLGRVGAAFTAQQRFVADAAHELRSPLTALKLQAQALRRAHDESSRDAAIVRLNEGIERSIRLVGQLLALAREEAAQGKTDQSAPVDLQHVVRELVSDALPHAQARAIDLGVVASEAVTVQGQAEAVQILLRNLLENALKYTPEGGQVDLALYRDDGTPCVTVEDSGPGIAPADRERVFDRFYRLPDTGATGSGLGLAIVATVARRLGAQVQIDNSPRLGGLRATVRFAAPRQV